MRNLTILGATGTIGINTLDVVARNPQRFRVVALSANRDVARLSEQCRQWDPSYAAMADPVAAEQLQAVLSGSGLQTTVLSGVEGLETIASLPEIDTIMAAIVGAAGLLPTLAGARAGKRVLLANKEALVMSGRLLIDAVIDNGAQLLPIDSEHNAIFQCMLRSEPGSRGGGVERILLTGSGGPFRTTPVSDLARVTPDQACAHPNWVMGRKISVDSATMMNKGLEVIEACWLFGVSTERIEVVIHPQSIVHSMVEYCDGSVLAQLGNPDMRTPIAHALAWPDRVLSGVERLDLKTIGRLDFSDVDLDRFPCLRLGFEAAERGGRASAALNAANEVAVQAFLESRIRFTDIARVNESVVAGCASGEPNDIAEAIAIDAEHRELANREVSKLDVNAVTMGAGA